MHKIDADGHVANQFVLGTPGVQVATQVDDEWLNAIQDEIAYFIATGCGITLVKNTNTQLNQAIHRHFLRAGAEPSYRPNGFGALPNGLLLRATDEDSHASAGYQRVILKTDTTAGINTTELWLTVNAKWNASTGLWDKDDATAASLAIALQGIGSINEGVIAVYKHIGASGFASSAWGPAFVFTGLPYPAPANGWDDAGGGTEPGTYTKGPDNVVRLAGCISLFGTGAITDTIATLPAGFRRSTGTMRFQSSYLDTTHKQCTILITTAGVMTTDALVGAQVRLDGISFVPDS